MLEQTPLHRIIYGLQKHKTLNLFAVFAYGVFICFMHDPLVKVSVVVMNELSLPAYNQLVAVLSGLLLLLLLAYCGNRLYQNRYRFAIKVFYLVATVVLMAVHYRTMFEMNIEIVHSLEYTILAFLLYPLTQRYGTAILFAVPFMLLDEWLQFVVLYPTYVEYFEFNDVMMDIYGCAMMMLLLMISGVQLQKKVMPVWNRTEFWILGIAVACCFLAWQVCYVALYDGQQCENTWLVLNKIKGEQGFWRQFPGRDVIYHVMQPVEAFFSISALLVFYFGLDSLIPESAITRA